MTLTSTAEVALVEEVRELEDQVDDRHARGVGHVLQHAGAALAEEVLAAAPGLHAEVHREHMVRLVAVLLEGRDRVGRIRARSGLARA